MIGICAGVEPATQLGSLGDGQIMPLQYRISLEPWFLDDLVSIRDRGTCQSGIRHSCPGSLPAESHMRFDDGSMAWGPLVVKDAQDVLKLRAQEPAPLALDVESHGVAPAASICSTPAQTIHAVVVTGVVADANNSKMTNGMTLPPLPAPLISAPLISPPLISAPPISGQISKSPGA
ncbi:MAG: hypothetical protein WAM11_16385 [Cyanobium sp.]